MSDDKDIEDIHKMGLALVKIGRIMMIVGTVAGVGFFTTVMIFPEWFINTEEKEPVNTSENIITEVRVTIDPKDEWKIADKSKTYLTFPDDVDFTDPILDKEFELCKNEGKELRYYTESNNFYCEDKT